MSPLLDTRMAPRRPPADQQPVRAQCARPRRRLCWQVEVAPLLLLLSLLVLPPTVPGQDEAAGKAPFEPVDGACGDEGPWTEGLCRYDAEGRPNEYCGPCLVGAEWDDLREKLGTELHRGRREQVVTIKYPQWLSASMMSSVFRILVTEMLGYDVKTFSSSSVHEVEEAASDTCAAVNLEMWYSEKDIVERYVLKEQKATVSSIGYIGREGIFVHNYDPLTVADVATMQSALAGGSSGQEYASLLAPDGTFGTENLTKAFPGSEPHYGCNATESSWSVSQCVQGRWYPPQCGSTYPSPDCFELYIPKQTFSAGWWEAVVRNMNFSVAVVYTGSPALVEMMEKDSSQAFLHYWWEPDPLILANPSLRLQFPDTTKKCQDSYHYDPMLSGVDCDREIVSLDKIINQRLYDTEPDVAHLYRSTRLGNSGIQSVLKYHSDSGGNYSSVEAASCAWMKDNPDVWESWLNISDPCAGQTPRKLWDSVAQECVVVPNDAGTGRVLWYTAIPIIGTLLAVLLGGAVFVLVLRRFRGKDAQSPPKQGEPITIAITDIQGSTTLWENVPPEVMASDINLHHKCLRARLKDCSGYEIATEGDSFKCAFHTPEDAIMWAIWAQLDLLCAPWSAVVEDGGHELLCNEDTWADTTCPLLEFDPAAVLGAVSDGATSSGFHMLTARKGARKGWSPMFSVAESAQTEYSRSMVQKSGAHAVLHKPTGALLPLYRGLRVRIGLHSGIADEVGVNETTKRRTYGGAVMKTAEAVAHTPCGGQIIMSGESLAAICSIQDLMAQVGECCQQWKSAPAPGKRVESLPSSFSVAHLGSHVLEDLVGVMDYTKRNGPSRDPSKFDILAWLSSAEDGASPDPSGASNASGSTTAQSKKNSFLLSHARELVTIVPWPLHDRLRYQQLPSSHMQVTPAWNNAPGVTGAPVSIVFLYVSHWKTLQGGKLITEECAARTRETLNTLVRDKLNELNGYEVEGEDCAFVLSFESPEAAVNFAVATQRAVTEADWEPSLTAKSGFEQVGNEEGTVVMRGPRLKIGVCTGTPARVQVCPRTGRLEYLGSIMNRAARISALANGGQSLIAQDTQKLVDCHESLEHVVLRHVGDFKLKGVASSMPLYEASSESAPHTFEALDSSKQLGLSDLSSRGVSRAARSPAWSSTHSSNEKLPNAQPQAPTNALLRRYTASSYHEAYSCKNLQDLNAGLPAQDDDIETGGNSHAPSRV